MAQYLPFVMQQLFNTPLLLNSASAEMIVAALSNRLDIRSLATETERLDKRGLEDLAAMGREKAEVEMASGEGPGKLNLGEDGDWLPYQLTSSGIAVLPVKGVLKREWGLGPYSGATGYDGLWAQLMHAFDNEKVKTMVFDINSGGGTPDGLFDLTDGMIEMSARNGGKKMIALVGSCACSAAYAIAAACDEISAPRLSSTGSIGCVIIHSEVSAMLKEEGVNVSVVRSRGRKMRGNPMEAIDEETLKEFQESVDEVDEFFVEKLAAYRPKLLEKNIVELDGRDVSGRRALATGLIDYISSEQDAWARVEQEIAD